MLAFFFVFLLSFNAFAQNLLKNGGFEDGLSGRIPKFWGTEYYNCSLTDGKTGRALKITNKIPLMSLGAQEIKINPASTPKLSLSAWVKVENVKEGVEDWNKANIQLLFFDAKGAQVGGWPELGKWTGTFGWQRFAKNFVVPKEAVRAKIVFGLYNCTGIVYFDDVELAPLKSTKSSDPYNLIENGGFELWEKWAFGGTSDWGIVFDNVKEGNGSLWIKNTLPIWSFASQSISLDGSKIKKITISGYVKAKDVEPGVKPWQLARINIEFKDGKGKRLGGWPIIDQFSGTFDWKYVKQTFDVPKETKRVDIFCGLLECKGEAWFDGLILHGFDKFGKMAKGGGLFSTNTSSWFAFQPVQDKLNGSIVDLSYLLDKPAGKHGFLKAKDGHFYFEDGVRARFWGTNIYAPATFMSKEASDKMSARLAKYGCNLVRIHHLDAFWSNPNIFDQNFNDTQHLSADSLDKLDYLIYKLEQNGIYIFMDLLVDREFKEGDNVADYKNVERGAKVTGFFDPRIIELQKIYARQLLTHYNPYTKMRYVDDPAIVSAKIINEAMLFYIGTQFGLSKYYLDELDARFNDWLIIKYGNRGSLEQAWTDKYGRCDLTLDEDPKKGNVARADTPLKYQRSGGEKREPQRLADTLRFYEEVQAEYYKDMQAYLQSIGYKGVISGSNHWVNVAADVKSNAVLDYVDRHRYWDHPQFGYGTQIVFEDQSMLKSPADALPNNFAFYAVKDKPFVISEWNCCFPNEFRAEGPVIMASYANLQDWDGVLQFSFNNPNWAAPMEDNFDISSWPNVLTQWQAAARIFYRGDVSPAKNEIIQGQDETDLYGPINEDEPIFNDPFLPLISKTSMSFNPGESMGDTREFKNKFHDDVKKEIQSDTREIKWIYGKGIFEINTQKTQAVLGFIKNAPISLKDFSINSANYFASIALLSFDDKPLASTSRALLCVSARIENKGQKYIESKTQLAQVGNSPLLVEGVQASITLKRTPKYVRALDINGNPIKNIAIAGKSFKISASDKVFYYEIGF